MKITKEQSDKIYDRYLFYKNEGKLRKKEVYRLLSDEFDIGVTTAWDHSKGREKGFTVVTEKAEPKPIELPKVLAMPSRNYKPINGKSTYIITGWEIRVGVNESFLDCLNQIANYYDAEKLLVPVWKEDIPFIPTVLKDNFTILDENHQFNSNLIFHYVPTHALTASPLAGWGGAFPSKTAILPGLIKELITEPSNKYCKQLISTGSVGYLNANYEQYEEITPEHEEFTFLRRRWTTATNRAVGKTTAIAQKFIKPSALIIDILDDDTFLTRYITMNEDGVIYDLNRKFTSGKKQPESSSPLALVAGDYHAYEVEESSHRATMEMIALLNPGTVVLNDFFDGASVNHHEVSSAVSFHSAPSIAHEAEITKKLLREICDVSNSVLYMHSNHENFIYKLLDMSERYWRLNGNYADCCELQAYRMKTGRHPIIKLLDLDEFENLTFVHEKTDNYINNTLVKHGHEFYRGGGFRSFAKTYNNIVIGHTHQPGVFRNAVNVGTNAKRDMSYSIGASAVMAANGLIQPDSSVQLLPIIDGLWIN